jgi:predicted PilT family ATPase
MGARGANIQKVCSDFNVQIKIPDRKSNKPPQNGTTNENNENTNGQENSDIIRINGRKENCEDAAAALKALVPINIEVDVPFEFHRFIIGRGGENVRQLMNKHDVNIKVPSSDQQSSIIVVTGPKAYVESAEKELLSKVEELEKEKAEKELKSFEIKLDIKPEYHPKIIGHKGGVISKFRTDFDVNIQLPKRDHPEQSTITITGYESNAIKARDAIMKKIEEYESMTKEEVMIDSRVHSMIIGRKGTGIRKIQQEYNVEIKLPREGDPNPHMVIIMGGEEGVLDCKDHLLNVQEEYLQDAIDKQLLEEYEKPPSRSAERSLSKNSNTDGFKVVKGAPWQGASDEAAFPTLGGGSTTSSVSSTPIAWGPKR